MFWLAPELHCSRFRCFRHGFFSWGETMKISFILKKSLVSISAVLLGVICIHAFLRLHQQKQISWQLVASEATGKVHRRLAVGPQTSLEGPRGKKLKNRIIGTYHKSLPNISLFSSFVVAWGKRSLLKKWSGFIIALVVNLRKETLHYFKKNLF